MSEAFSYPFTDEQICSQAKGDAGAFLLVMIAYAKEHSLSAEEMFRFMGRKFAPEWEDLRESPVSEIAKWFALNWLACGAEVSSLSGDEIEAQIVTAGWPPAGRLVEFGLTREDADAIWAAPAAIAEFLGLTYEWRRDGDAVIETLRRAGAD